MKKRCWDDMLVTGRSIQSFNGNVVVENYPLQEEKQEEKEELEFALQQIRIENAEHDVRKLVLANEIASHRSLVGK